MSLKLICEKNEFLIGWKWNRMRKLVAFKYLIGGCYDTVFQILIDNSI